MQKLIGLCGPMGAGKSTTAGLICEGYFATIRPFAEPLKKMIEALGVDRKHIYGTQDEKVSPLPIFDGLSTRYAMQLLGTEFGRRFFGADFWVRAWIAGLGNVEMPVVVADDVRFPNEAAAIRERGGLVICIVKALSDFDRAPTHASENFTAIPHDVLVVNDGTKEELRAKISAAIAKHYLPADVYTFPFPATTQGDYHYEPNALV